MIQFNLLPAVKIEYIRARRTKRVVVFGAAGTVIVSLAALLLLCTVVFVWQNLRLKSLDKSIKASAADIQGRQDINKVLTIQNQLSSIDMLHSEKPETPRLFTYITQVTPSKITIQSYAIDFDVTTPTMTFTGQAPSLEEVNKFVDTLKFTTYAKNKDDTSNTKAFSQVVLTAFGRDDKGASFTISVSYDPAIFSSDETDLTLSVPKITTTRSETERPADLFQQNQTPLGETKP